MRFKKCALVAKKQREGSSWCSRTLNVCELWDLLVAGKGMHMQKFRWLNVHWLCLDLMGGTSARGRAGRETDAMAHLDKLLFLQRSPGVVFTLGMPIDHPKVLYLDMEVLSKATHGSTLGPHHRCHSRSQSPRDSGLAQLQRRRQPTDPPFPLW